MIKTIVNGAREINPVATSWLLQKRSQQRSALIFSNSLLALSFRIYMKTNKKHFVLNIMTIIETPLNRDDEKFKLSFEGTLP